MSAKSVCHSHTWKLCQGGQISLPYLFCVLVASTPDPRRSHPYAEQHIIPSSHSQYSNHYLCLRQQRVVHCILYTHSMYIIILKRATILSDRDRLTVATRLWLWLWIALIIPWCIWHSNDYNWLPWQCNMLANSECNHNEKLKHIPSSYSLNVPHSTARWEHKVKVVSSSREHAHYTRPQYGRHPPPWHEDSTRENYR